MTSQLNNSKKHDHIAKRFSFDLEIYLVLVSLTYT
jgi:hypothetical protein